jgi:hypothetical protein
MKTFAVSIVVPTHREIPTVAEEIGLRRCAEISSHPITLVTPESLSIRAYEKLLPISSHIRVDDYWMSSIYNYNRLMLSGHLFSFFDDLTHILIHEPDAILLNDQLQYWCAQPLDYIGAPWFTIDRVGNEPAISFENGQGLDLKLFACGNSGLSLINISAFGKLRESRTRWYPLKEAVKDVVKGAVVDAGRLKKGMLALGISGQIRGAWQIYGGNCDLFWSFILSNTKDRLRIADPLTALAFAWETHPQECSKIAHGHLPMGLHAWWKYEPIFVIQLLRNRGIFIPSNLSFNS